VGAGHSLYCAYDRAKLLLKPWSFGLDTVRSSTSSSPQRRLIFLILTAARLRISHSSIGHHGYPVVLLHSSQGKRGIHPRTRALEPRSLFCTCIAYAVVIIGPTGLFVKALEPLRRSTSSDFPPPSYAKSRSSHSQGSLLSPLPDVYGA
jgi:hypothetical protein